MSVARLTVPVALPVPLPTLFDYAWPENQMAPMVGCRVRVPFGRRSLVGVVLGEPKACELAANKVKTLEVIDAEPILDAAGIKLFQWLSRYYTHPIGDTIFTGIPALLRQGEPAVSKPIPVWALSEQGEALTDESFGRAAKRRELFSLLQQYPQGLSAAELNDKVDNWRRPMQEMVSRLWVEQAEQSNQYQPELLEEALPATDEQQTAINAITSTLGQFQPFLLDGITGSGKTEVYLQAIREAVLAGKQVLVLVPEIGLTPQLVSRFTARFGHCGVLHSAMTDSQRLDVWVQAKKGLSIVIGTRSAVFTPMPKLGLIIVDEEHDGSFKQQDGLRYSARDVAVVRGQFAACPVVLGSGTPSLQSLHNAQSRYTHLRLTQRASGKPPSYQLVDIRGHNLTAGLSHALLTKMREHLQAGQQVMLFLNRRGFAPVMMCHDCGWSAACPSCDANLTVHQHSKQTRCHHCGHQTRLPSACPSCDSRELLAVGLGTERLEHELAALFPHYPITRIDRDSTRRKGSLEAKLDKVATGEPQILIGTQMLAKGHHLPNITLVGLIDIDQGLFSPDFRAAEDTAQLIVQVAGRAGRGEKPGTVLIQTHCPDNRLLQQLVTSDYVGFAHAALEEREATGWPPYSYIVLLRAEFAYREVLWEFLQQAKQCFPREIAVDVPSDEEVLLMGPAPALMERRQNRYRGQLLVLSKNRQQLRQQVAIWDSYLRRLDSAAKVRWSLDVDPSDLR